MSAKLKKRLNGRNVYQVLKDIGAQFNQMSANGASDHQRDGSHRRAYTIESFEKPQIQNSLRRTLKEIFFENRGYSKSSIRIDKYDLGISPKGETFEEFKKRNSKDYDSSINMIEQSIKRYKVAA